VLIVGNIIINYSDGKIISLSGNFKTIFYITVILVAVLAFVKMIKTTLNPPPPPENKSSEQLQKKQKSQQAIPKRSTVMPVCLKNVRR